MTAKTGVKLPSTLPPETKRQIEEILEKDVTLIGQHWEFIGKCLGVIDRSKACIDATDFALEFTQFVKIGRFVATLSRILSVADIILGPLGHVIAIAKGSVTGRVAFVYAGMAYGMTAWAFGDRKPQASKIRMKNLMLSVPQDRILWEQAWTKGVDSIQRGLEELSSSGPKGKKTLQVVLRAMGEDSPQQLNYLIMKSMEDKIMTIGSLPGGTAGLLNWRYYNERHAYPD